MWDMDSAGVIREVDGLAEAYRRLSRYSVERNTSYSVKVTAITPIGIRTYQLNDGDGTAFNAVSEDLKGRDILAITYALVGMVDSKSTSCPYQNAVLIFTESQWHQRVHIMPFTPGSPIIWLDPITSDKLTSHFITLPAMD